MIWNPLKIFSKKILGIDIGTSTIRIVELSSWRGRAKLENYGEIKSSSLHGESFRRIEGEKMMLSDTDISKGIRAIIEKSGMEAEEVIFSLPDFSTFFTVFSLPRMEEDELKDAIAYEARRYVPLPLKKVTLDWEIVENDELNARKPIKVILAAISNELIDQYKQIAELSELNLNTLEAEVFSLVRSQMHKKEDFVAIEIGARTTTVSVIHNNNLAISHSIDVGGDSFSDILVEKLNFDYEQAEEVKKEIGIKKQKNKKSSEKNIRQFLLYKIDRILNEVEQISEEFNRKQGVEPKEIILAGAAAQMPGLVKYTEDYLGKKVKISNPFVNISYPPILNKKLKEIGPSYSIAIGSALKEIVQNGN